MDTQLMLRLIELVKKTGDRLVLADQTGGDAVVVMDLAAYERLLERSESRSAIVHLPELRPGPSVEVDGNGAGRLTPTEAGASIKAEIGNPKEGISSGRTDAEPYRDDPQPGSRPLVQQPATPPAVGMPVRPADEPEDEGRFYLEPIE